MKVHIKDMVNNRCKIIVKSELEKLGLQCNIPELGVVEITGNLSDEQQELLDIGLKESGLALINDRKSILIEKIKNIIIELVHYSEKRLKINFSEYLSQELNYDYTYLANLFSEHQGNTIEHFFLTHKTERAKELLIYGDLNITEIADKLHYSSTAHLSNQFKKMTGLTPSKYKNLKLGRHKGLQNA